MMDKESSSECITIEELFRFEILVVKLCGGLMFRPRSILAVIYRLFIILAARYVFSKYILNMTTLMNNQRNALWDNIRIFWKILIYLAIMSLSVSLWTGYKYSNLVILILKKRFKRHLLYRSNTSVFYQSQSKQEKLANLNCFEKRDISKAAQSSNAIELKQPLSSRVDLLRKLMIYLVILATSIAFMREEMSLNRQHLIQTDTLNTSRPLSYIKPKSVYLNSTDKTPTGSGIALLETQAYIPQLMNAILLKDFISIIKFFILMTFRFCLKILQTSMNTFQVYGPAYIMLMMCATFTDMITQLRFRLALECRGDCNHWYNMSFISRSSSDSFIHSQHSRSLTGSSCDGRMFAMHMTVEYLTHIRDALLVIREAFSMDNLILLTLELVRLMLIFSFLTSFIMKTHIEWFSTILFELLRINSSMIILRLGYYWLHQNAKYLRQDIVERELLDADCCGSNKVGLGLESRTIVKLARELEEIWPTHWYIPDLKSIISQNLFVTTLVATSEQLVTAARINRVDSLKNNS